MSPFLTILTVKSIKMLQLRVLHYVVTFTAENEIRWRTEKKSIKAGTMVTSKFGFRNKNKLLNCYMFLIKSKRGQFLQVYCISMLNLSFYFGV